MASTEKPSQLSLAHRSVTDLLTGRHAFSFLLPLSLWLFDAVLCVGIIWKMPYTEIDWKAYMEQVSQFVEGERDYPSISGGTGPLVYPAAHVYTYTALYYVTNGGKDILLAQQLFAALYLLTLAVVMQCYWRAKVPPYIYPLLILSKRLHSVFILRCFNDCFAVLFLWLTIYALQRKQWTLGSLLYSWGLGIKMTLLLILPAVGVILFLGRGFHGSIRLAWLMAQIQIAIGLPFLARNPMGYISRAFELSRQFKFEWTVNWRMVGEEVFLSRSFALTLLALHGTVLVAFIVAKWFQPAGCSVFSMVPDLMRGQSPFRPREEREISRRVRPRFIMHTILSANVVGLLFARSLHYQFYAYLAWATPYLLWQAMPQPALVFLFWGLQEWAWNVFPSTDGSSGMVVNILGLTVTAAYFSASTAFESDAKESRTAKVESKKQR